MPRMPRRSAMTPRRALLARGRCGDGRGGFARPLRLRQGRPRRGARSPPSSPPPAPAASRSSSTRRRPTPRSSPGRRCSRPMPSEMARFAGMPIEPTPMPRKPAPASSDQVAVDAILITRGERGMTLCRRGGEPPLHVAAETHRVFDVTGAGDTVVATLAAALAAGAPLADAVRLANAAAGVAVTKPGTATVSPAELKQALGVAAAANVMTAAEARDAGRGVAAAGPQGRLHQRLLRSPPSRPPPFARPGGAARRPAGGRRQHRRLDRAAQGPRPAGAGPRHPHRGARRAEVRRPRRALRRGHAGSADPGRSFPTCSSRAPTMPRPTSSAAISSRRMAAGSSSCRSSPATPPPPRWAGYAAATASRGTDPVRFFRPGVTIVTDCDRTG